MLANCENIAPLTEVSKTFETSAEEDPSRSCFFEEQYLENFSFFGKLKGGYHEEVV